MEEKKILVTGGKGKTGRKVVERLTAPGRSIRIGSRSETPSFDWENPETWQTALEGMDSVYITFQPDLAVPGAREKIEAFSNEAVENGIRKTNTQGADAFLPSQEFITELHARMKISEKKMHDVIDDLIAYGEKIQEYQQKQGKLPRSYLHKLGIFLDFWLNL